MVFGANPVVFGSKYSDILGTYSGYLEKYSGIFGQNLVKKKVLFMANSVLDSVLAQYEKNAQPSGSQRSNISQEDRMKRYFSAPYFIIFVVLRILSRLKHIPIVKIAFIYFKLFKTTLKIYFVNRRIKSIVPHFKSGKFDGK
mgnify:CR=1 FL=1